MDSLAVTDWLVNGLFVFVLGQGASNPDAQLDDIDADDCTRLETDINNYQDWRDPEIIESIRDRFVTGDWNKAAKRGQPGENLEDDDDAFGDDEVFGDFEDLETGEKHIATGLDGDDEDEAKPSNGTSAPSIDEDERRLKKLALRARFDAQYPSQYLNIVFLLLDVGFQWSC